MNNKLFAVLALALFCAFNFLFSAAQAQGTGVIWTPRGNPGTWTSIVCSADGTKVYAAFTGSIYASTDSGVTWAQRNNSQSWYYVTCSPMAPNSSRLVGITLPFSHPLIQARTLRSIATARML